MVSRNELEVAQSEADEGQWTLADARVSHILQVRPDDTQALRLKARICHARGLPRLTAAILHQVATLENAPQAWLEAAVAHRRVADLKAAEEAVRAFLRLRPGHPEGVRALAELLHRSGRSGEAMVVLESVPAANQITEPNHLKMVSRILADLGRRQEALEFLRRAHALDPMPTWSELLCRLAEDNQLPGAEYRAEIQRILPAEFQRWIHPARVFPKGAQPDKRLRIGYVGSDFNAHAVSSYLLELFAAHDRKAIECWLFAEVPRPDATTARFQALADHWVSTEGMSDQDLCTRIRAAGIDILVDLNGFTGGHRLGAFALRSAPIQAVYTVGFGPTRGMPNLDVKFTNHLTEPLETAQAWSSETLIALDGPRLNFAWPQSAPEPGPLPCTTGQPFTFGCLNSVHKIEERTTAVFAALLRAEPEARLLLLWPSLEDAAGIQDRYRRFEALGVRPGQLDFVPRTSKQGYLAYYQRVDLALNPLSAFGATTILEALWMGVPVLHFDAPTGMRHSGRYLAQQLGWDEWLVDSEAAFVAQARAWMHRREDLAELRRTLRSRAAAAPISDARTVARTLEGAYRALWRDWCEGRFPYRAPAEG